MYEALFARSGLSLERLRSLIQVADAGGISRAVGDDPARQSLVSRQLKELEEFFEVELTRRDGKRLALTPAGRALVEVAREHLAALDDFAKSSREEVVRFQLGAGDSLLHWHIVPRLRPVQRALPRVTLRLVRAVATTIAEQLLAMGLDFGVMRAERADRSLASEPLGTLAYSLFAPRALVRSRQRPDVRWILEHVPTAVTYTDEGLARWWRTMRGTPGLPDKFALECETFPQAARAVSSGAYAAILPRAARADFDRDTVVEVRGSDLEPLTHEVALVWNPRLIRTRSAADSVRRELADALRW
jgi:DNA-binding transcriptional LysR family regulator